MTPEGKIVAYLQKRVKELGGMTRKVSWEGRVGAPDQLILLPGVHAFIECKAPGKRPIAIQLKEMERLRWAGFETFVVDSYAQVDRVLADLIRS